MKRDQNIFVKFNSGLDSYEPASAPSSNLRFARLVNFEARKGSLVVSTGLDKLKDINSLFNSFGSYTTSANSSYLYAFTDSAIYQWSQTLVNFSSSPLALFTPNVDEPYAVVDYLDGLYFTRHGVQLKRAVDSVVSNVTSDQAKYALNAHDHLFLLNLNITGGGFLMKWSDIYDFTNFTPTTTNEADQFTFNSSHGEITGVSLQKDIVNIYTEKSIFQATYVGYPVKYEISPLYTDVGNKFHHAVIQHKDIDYFIAEDNFYKLEGTLLTPIGTKIWDFFKNSLVTFDFGQEIRGVVDPDRDRVGWLFTRIYDATYPDGLRASKKYFIWYNPKEDRWTTEEADFISLYRTKKRVYFYKPIDSMSQIIDSETRTIDGLWQADRFLYQGGLFGGEDESIYVSSLGYDGKILHMETAEIHMDKPYELKTLTRVTFHADIAEVVDLGEVDIFEATTIQLGYRRLDGQVVTWITLTADDKVEANALSYAVPSSMPVSQSIAFRFTYPNIANRYITALNGVTLTFSVPTNADDIN